MSQGTHIHIGIGCIILGVVLGVYWGDYYTNGPQPERLLILYGVGKIAFQFGRGI